MLINDVHTGDEVTLFHQALEIRPRRLRVDEIVRRTRPGETRAVRQVLVTELDYGTSEPIPSGAMVEVPGAFHPEQRSLTGEVYLASELTSFEGRQDDYERWYIADRAATEGADEVDAALSQAGIEVHRITPSVSTSGAAMVRVVLTAPQAVELARLVATGRSALAGG